MENSRPLGTLGDIAEIIMGQSPKGVDCNETGNGYPLLNGPTEFSSRHPEPTQFTTDPKKYAEKGDLLFCVRGSTTGRMNWAEQRYAIGRGIGALRHKLGKEYQPYLRALIEFKLPVLLQSATGSTFPNVSRNQLLDLEIDILPEKDALKISKIIDVLDQRIYLNIQTNQTLEQMAQALFKSWFVDFDPVTDNALAAGNDIPEALQHRAEQRKTAKQLPDFKPLPDDIQALFPSEFEQIDEQSIGIAGWVPKGWNISELGYLVDFATGPAFKSANFGDQGIRLSRGDNVKEGFFHWGTKTRYWPEITPELKKHELQCGDILIGMDGSKVGKNWVRVTDKDLPCLLVQRVARLRSKGIIGSSYLSVLIGGDTFKQYVETVKTGTSIPHISGRDIKQMKVLSPDDNGSIFRKFENILEDNFKRMSNSLSEIETLIKLRDVLLPKLISGEITLNQDVA